MTKNEFQASFQNELQKRHIPDWEDVVSEYEQHFALKQADGFSEEEIAAKLGAPAELAAQFEAADEGGKTPSGPAAHLIRFGVGAMDVVAALGMVVLAAWLVFMAALTVVCAVAGICLIFELEHRRAAALHAPPLRGAGRADAVGSVRPERRGHGVLCRVPPSALPRLWPSAEQCAGRSPEPGGAACSAPASPAEKGMLSPSAVGFRGAGDPLCTVPRRLRNRIRRQRRFAGILACMGLVWIWSIGGTKSRFI